MSKKLQNAVVFGSGKVHTGEYNKVTIYGHGKVLGPVKLRDASFHGIVRVKDGIEFHSMKTEGNSKFHGDIKGDKLQTKGDTVISGKVKVNQVYVKGRFYSKSRIKANLFKSHGHLNLVKGIECDEMDIRGYFQVSGLIDANSIKITFINKSKAQEITGEQIHIQYKKQENWFRNKISSNELEFKVDAIEGNLIEIENTVAKHVRGQQVIIGPKCQIDYVEYTDSIEISPESKVRERKKIK